MLNYNFQKLRIKRQYKLKRRGFCQGLICSPLMIHQSDVAVSPHQLTNTMAEALSGHEFRMGQMAYRLRDVTSPIAEDLMPSARSFFDEARSNLQNLLMEGLCEIHPEGKPDRWGNIHCTLIDPKSGSDLVQQELLKSGSVRVNPISENLNRLTKDYHAEKMAIENKAGLWALPYFRIRNANEAREAHDCPGAFHVFEGRVEQVYNARARTYLNFGSDYKTDVTLTIENSLRRQFIDNGIDLITLEAQRIQFRGYVQWINGPSVALRHLQALQILQ